MKQLIDWAERPFFWLLRFHPLANDSDFYEEMRSTYAQVAGESPNARQSVLRELFDLPGVIIRGWILRRKTMGKMIPLALNSPPPTPWRTALLSLLPYVWFGPIMLSISYLPAWRDPVWGPWFWYGQEALAFTFICIGVFLGSRRAFPRWSYLYVAGGVAFLAGPINLVFRQTPLHNQQLLALVIATTLFTVVTFRWRLFRPFWDKIRQEWTHLSYALYIFVLLLAAGMDHDEAPILTVTVLLPSLIALMGGLAHLRAKTTLGRILALVISLTLVVPIWGAPLLDGMTRSLAAIVVVLGTVLGLYGILLAFLLLPAFIGLFPRSQSDQEPSSGPFGSGPPAGYG